MEDESWYNIMLILYVRKQYSLSLDCYFGCMITGKFDMFKFKFYICKVCV